MGTTLQGNQIKITYDSLIKVGDNTQIDPTTLKQLSDGVGNDMAIAASGDTIKFLGDVDYTAGTDVDFSTANVDLSSANISGIEGVTTSSLMTTASYDSGTSTLTFTKGDGSTFDIAGIGGGGGGTPAGSDSQVQYNDAGSFGASSKFRYLDATETLQIDNMDLQAIATQKAAADADEYVGYCVEFGNYSGPYTIGSVYYLDSSLNWSLAGSGSEAAVSGILGIATETSTNRFMVRGEGRHAGYVSLTNAAPIYLDDAGEVTATKPTTKGDFIKKLGWCTNSGQRIIYFAPSETYYEI